LKASKNDGEYMDNLTTLVKSARRGDSGAYEQVVRRFQDMAVGYAYSLLGDWQDAEDVAQDAFIYAYYSLTKFPYGAVYFRKSNPVTPKNFIHACFCLSDIAIIVVDNAS